MSAFLQEARVARQILRTDGIRAVFQKYGWKLFAGLFVYYLVRDMTLYVLVPFLMARSLS